MEAPQSIFLSSDERYDIWEVKQVERPELLLHADDEASVGSVEDENDEDQKVELPLVDGCDIPGWRKSKLVQCSSFLSASLNIGPGCSMMRRETQLPMLSQKSLSQWKGLQRRLLEEPSRNSSAARISKKDAIDLPFYPWFEQKNVPAILEGLTDDWNAMESCTWDALVGRFGDYYWRFSDTHGACMTLETYDKYIKTLEGMSDDAPLAVYDSQLDGDERACLLDDYTVPYCFAAPDLFEELDEQRPPYRWILMGPERSGTGLHIDPLGTHAWVTVVEGLKRWVLFPYGTDKATIGMQDPQIPSAIWFSQWYTKAIEAVPGAVEVLQRPGETVYVPSGWPHLVLNLETTVAITHNYATEYPTMERISLSVQQEEPEMFPTWMESLQVSRPDLASDAHSRRTR